jgi:PAS domain S-box-containing protein
MIAVAVLLLSGMTVAVVENNRLQERQRAAATFAAEAADEINDRLSRSLSATYALAAVVRQGRGEIIEFDRLADEMLGLYGGISCLQLAPDGVIRSAFPLAGNEKAIGHNLLVDTARNKEALLAVRMRTLTLAGPFELIQGGVAIIGRLPVYLPDRTGKEQFWGFTTAMIRIPELLKVVNIQRLVERGYGYEISRVHPDSGKRQVFARAGGAVVSPVQHVTEVPNGHWTLAVSPQTGWCSSELLALEITAAALFSLGIGILFHWLLSQPLRLQRMVDERTSQLSAVNELLQREIQSREQAQREQLIVQQELKESEERYRSIISNMQDVFYRSDSEGRLVMISQSGAELLGYDSPQQMIGMVIRDNLYFDPRERDAFVSNLKLKGLLSGYEVTLKRKEGTPVPVATSTHLLFNTAGSFCGVEGIFRDISEQRRADEALRLSEEKFSKAFSQAPLLMTISDIGTGRYLEVNNRFCQISGYSQNEAVGRTSLDLGWISAEERDRLIGILKRDGRVLDIELSLTAKDGHTVICLYSAEIIHVEGTDRLLSIAMDITQRKRTEGLLRESEQRYRILFNAESDAIVVIDAETMQHIDVNDSAVEMYGYSRPELLMLNPAGLSAEPEETERRISEGKGLVRIPLRYHRKKDGTVFPVEISARFFEYGGRKILLAAMRDISEIQKLQQERDKSQRLESLGLLAGGIAHDFNNILTGIIGNLSLARVMIDGEHRAAGRLDECEKAARRAGELTQQLLTFARGGEPVKKVMDATRLIDEALSFTLSGSKVKGELDIAPDLWAVEVDGGQINQVLNNLLINAVQAMPVGGTVTVSARNENGENETDCFVRISIRDTGSGIPADILPRIFDPYFSTKSEGTGLGLASVYSIIARHGGSITVSSEPGCGTEFKLRLPAVTKPVSGKQANDGAGPGTGLPMRVLIMDDEEMIREVAVMMLSEIGCSADACGNGREAVALYQAAIDRNAPYDAVILDLTVPGGMGGLEAAGLIKSIDPLATLIVSSGYSQDAVTADFRAHGFSGAVMKPYSMEMFTAELGRIVASRRPDRAGTQPY